uniref:Uncharacterized protein n=1 Tax=Arundo donax TaxID=35708 RepID=A0A0A9BD03_ARUDO
MHRIICFNKHSRNRSTNISLLVMQFIFIVLP